MLNKKIITLNITLSVLAVFFFAAAATLNPSSGPGDTMKTIEDVYCKYAGCTPAGYGRNSSSTPGSTMYNLQQAYNAIESWQSIDYSKQKNLVYDDYNCANNNQETNSACEAGDGEFTGEEAVWASSTDANLNGALVASGKVYRDVRAQIYWADAYDAISGSNTPDTLTNSFTMSCSDAEVNNGACLQDNYSVKGQAIQYCLDLSLDATGDGVDETDWYLPSQKELMQAYLDGAGNNLPNADYSYWSSTEFYSNASYAWYAFLSYGITDFDSKTNGTYARCVRR
jgi:hypothetical protein